MKKQLLLLILLSLANCIKAQLLIDKFPAKFSLYARELPFQFALVEISGGYANATSADSIFLKKIRNGELVYKKYLHAKPIVNDYRFQYTDSLMAELAHTSYELWLGEEELLLKVDSVCAGDVYLFNGQSNAEAAAHGESCKSMLHPFIRTYGKASEKGFEKRWYVAGGDGNRDTDGHIGQLGIAFATQIIEELQMPICILNGAVGGKPLSYFMPDKENRFSVNTNYGRLLQRVTEVDMTDKIRAIIWYQGEQDAALNTDASEYVNLMQDLYENWQTDYNGIEHLYMYQIRNGCKLDIRNIGNIQQAQYNFAKQHSNITLLSSNLAKQSQDGCHFTFHEGYVKLSKQLLSAITYQQYFQDATQEFRSISLKQIEKVNPHEIRIYFTSSGQYEVDSLSKDDFYINQNMEHPSEIKVLPDGLQCYFLNPIPDEYTLSYCGHSGEIEPCITNQYGNGLLCFYNLGDTILVEKQSALEESLTSVNECNIFTAGNKLVVENNKQVEVDIEFTLYDVSGIIHQHEKGIVNSGRNEYRLKSNSGSYYILDIMIKDANYKVHKILKVMR
ncbi:MAG: hypothetical protein IPI46_03285 [Bacteroidetes bacterium]|nr:hypothetical protein [Bacteroidota bacterium]